MSAAIKSSGIASWSASQTCSRPDLPWVNVLAHLDPKYGGMSSAVPALSSAVYASGQHAVTLAGFCAAGEQASPSINAGVSVQHFPQGFPQWFKDGAARQTFSDLIANSSGVHVHGLWEPSTLLSIRAARQAAKPYLVSAHGMLQAWALNNRRMKKAIYGALIERSNLRHASCLHALTQAEVEDYRSYGLQNPVVVIPNGVEVPRGVDAEVFLNEFPHLRGKRLILFMSRLHVKKGLDILCQAWAAAAKDLPDAHLVLAGPDFENTRSSLETFISSHGIADRVTFTGMLNSALKWSALRAADCFVLPSYSEGLSVSVLEAMGMGLPVLITRQCNLPEVAELGCGWVMEPDAGALQSALMECFASPSAALERMSANGRRLVETNYNWDIVGSRMSEVYTWLQGGAVPSNVMMDRGGAQ